LLVDPPRKGLDQEVIDALIHSSTIKRLVYVSCGFKAFRENANQLLDSGCWDLVFAEGHVLFPGADHIETLAIFNSKL
jgi:23S rRNA (uracil1939-C5)-methyltransferase